MERIRTEKERLIKEKKIKRSKNESIIYCGEDNSYYEKFTDGTVKCIDDEIPFEIPNGWVWERLGNIATINGGKRIPAGNSLSTIDTGHTYIRVADMKNGTVITNDIHYISNDIYEQIKDYTISKDNLYITVAGTIGSIGEVPQELDNANLTENADKIVFYQIHKRFLLYALTSDTIQSQVKSCTTKVGQPKLAIIRIQNFLIPIPPIKEQKAISSMVDRLLLTINKYDQNQYELDKLNTSIKSRLKKSVLQEAIQGKLIFQDPNDEPASVLLERIRTEKKHLIKEKKIKRDKNESVIFKGDDNLYYEKIGSKSYNITDEIPFEIPNNWAWVRICSVINLLSGRDLGPSQYNVKSLGIPYITGASNFTNGTIIINRWTNTPVTISHKGDLLITCKGTIGKMAFNQMGDIHIARQIMAIEPHFISIEYLHFFLSFSVEELEANANSMIPGISRTTILGHLLPIPPIKEQFRIVEKINMLLEKLK
ncbi:restriction endonuclease subunit S [Prevotella sp.]|uniref:restriction endonuclease subunit S n=1 Tax=Prevotella sp. TaxID=59823 RepID=UPI0026475ED1|nr:restriction endonuclease subunit S [Prevotella sp.]MDN5554167.1 restriction endonuclease subunit S [Prevotella sp.]